MTPADRKELCAILKRALNRMLPGAGEEYVTRGDIVDALVFVEQIEIEPCPNPTSETSATQSSISTTGKATPTSLTSDGTESSAATNTPDLAAIRQAVESLEDVLEACGYDQDENVPPWAVAARRLVALDVPAVVERLADSREEADVMYDLYKKVVQRAEAAEARLRDCMTIDEWDRSAADLKRERDEARDKALEDAAVRTRAQAVDYAYQQIAYDALRDLEAAIRAMKGKP